MPAERRSAPLESTPRPRAAVSCDHCKRKRSRCIRPSTDAPCSNCVANDVTCESTLLRKQRVYGSVESLSQRFRALDALVVGLFPADDTKTLAGLHRLAADRGISLPPRDDWTPHQNCFAPQSASSSLAANTVAGDATQSVQHARPSSSRDTLRDERLVPTASGIGHYVGPSSSFRFINAIRRMLRDSDPHFGTEVDRDAALKKDFATLASSVALEQGGTGDSSPFGVVSIPAASRSERGQSDLFPRFPTLPVQHVANALVRSFFDQLHPHYPLFLRPVFQLQYEALWRSGSAVITGCDLGWLCCLAMMLIFGAQTSQADDALDELKGRCLTFVRTALGHIVVSASLVNLQALLLIQLYEHNSGQRNASWILLGCASRMAIALGMHLESANNNCTDQTERATRVRIWWTLFHFERTLCVMLGRPSAIDDLEVTLSLPDAMADSGDMPLRYTEFSMRLSQMQGQVRQSTFCPPESGRIPSVEDAQRVLHDLKQWYDGLPPHLRPEWRSMVPQQRRANLLLQINFENMIVLVTRPYLLHHVKRTLSRAGVADPPDVEAMREKCLTSAEKMVGYCHSLADEALLDPRGWLDVYFVYLGVLILSLDLLSPITSDRTLTADRQRRQETIRSILARLRGLQLAPTYQILIKIAHQFASISGALTESVPDPDPTSSTVHPCPGVSDPATSLLENGRFDEWLMQDLNPLPWDTFDMGAYTTLGVAPGLDSFTPETEAVSALQSLMSIPGAQAGRTTEWWTPSVGL